MYTGLPIVSYWKGPLKNSSLSGLSVTVVLNDISYKMIQLKYAVALLAMCVDPNRDNQFFIMTIWANMSSVRKKQN